MAFLLDTCVLSEFVKPRPSAAVELWMSGVPDTSQYVSVITFGELEKGIARLQKGKRRSALEVWLDELRDRMADRTLSVDLPVAREWGRVLARCDASGKTIPVIDALIGATAIVHGYGVVTRNTSDIAKSGAKVVDPWR